MLDSLVIPNEKVVTTIRSAVIADLPAVVDLELDAFGSGEALPHLVLRQYLDICGKFFVVAVTPSGLAGYGVAARTSNALEEGWILSVAVRGNMRSQGVGRAVVAVLIRELHLAGVKAVWATVSPENEPSRRMLRGAGFVDMRTENGYFGSQRDRIVVLLEQR